ncbi:15-hydroxyprostaglandin dehydrogenase [NAD(+)]-like [Epargyreus clarus]|uniref:15-hydroxyprostaglandin dehydrogenase [NAD(+)]-like n=1 Tax=Epargyreus clarus TaxID=520877 RepID=UPI003C2BE9D7
MVDNFMEHGAKTVIIVDKSEELGVKAIDSMTTKHGGNKAVFLKCDVTSDLDETFEGIIQKYKFIDIIVNNAGILDEKSIKSTININLLSLMEWSIKFYDYMRKDRGGYGGTIINVSSIYGLEITPFVTTYHASKFGVIGFTKSLGHIYNFKKTGVRVVALCPGFTYTAITATFSLRDDNMLADFMKEAKSHEWQEVDAVGKGVIDIFEKAESGTVWRIVGNRSAVMEKE